jgi:hypothetical protein
MKERLRNGKFLRYSENDHGWIFQFAGIKITPHGKDEDGDTTYRFDLQRRGILLVSFLALVLGYVAFLELRLLVIPISAFPWVVRSLIKKEDGSAPSLPGERIVRMSSRLLPSDVRERYLDEWLDDLQCRRDCGGRVWPATIWILFRSVLPLTILGIGTSALRRITGR